MVALKLLLLPAAAAFPAFSSMGPAEIKDMLIERNFPGLDESQIAAAFSERGFAGMKGMNAHQVAALFSDSPADSQHTPFDERAGILSILDPLRYQVINFWDTLMGWATALNLLDLTELTKAISEGVEQVEAHAKSNPKFGGWPVAQLADVPRAQLNKDAIYAAYKLDRNVPPIWGDAEDEDHPYIKPTTTDIRGPCPGLNTLANHGYLPRNGVVTPQELMLGVWQGLGMSPDLAGILAMAGILWKGDIKTMTLTIGSAKKGSGPGLSQHGFIEGDASITRDDSVIGDHVHLNETKLHRYYDLIHRLGDNGYDINPAVCAESRYVAWEESKNTNHAMDFNPIRHVVAYAESAFAMEVFRGQNKSCTSETINWFFVEERFPPGWSRRNVPITTNEILTWGLYFNQLRTVYPGYTTGVAGNYIRFPLSTIFPITDFLSPASLRVNACKFAAMFALFVPVGIIQFTKGLGPLANGYACIAR